MPLDVRDNFIAICGGLAVALAIGVISGLWVVAVVLGVVVGATTAERMRRRAAPPAERLPVASGRKKRKR